MKIDIEILERIFSDAHVKDICLSEWDSHVTFFVLADHYRDWIGERCPALLINFCRVSKLKIDFKHLSLNLPDPDFRFQWLVDSATFEEVDGGWDVKIAGSHLAAPITEILCESIDVEEVQHRDLDRFFSGWDKPSSGFTRPGIATLIAHKNHH